PGCAAHLAVFTARSRLSNTVIGVWRAIAPAGEQVMTAQSDEHERTMAFAEIALGQIKALRQPAYPRNYEIWYTYATGYNAALNQNINEALARKGSLSVADFDRIYETFLSPTRLTDRIDTVGAKVAD